MTRRSYVPERGDAISIASNHNGGHDPNRLRTAMVLSPKAYNGKVGLALLCPITDRVKGYPFEVPIPGNMKVTGAVLSDEIRSLDWRALKVEAICRLPEATVSEVLRKAAALLAT